jgi:hypothetical protein
MAGGGLLGTAVAASAATPTLTYSPVTTIPADPGDQAVLVSASGFSKHIKGGLSQCELVTGEPTISDPTTGQAQPVSCAPFEPIKTTGSGGLPITGYGITAGFNGPPASGTDSGGGDANADAANYPCPPTAAQAAAGATCVLVFALTDASATPSAESASAPVTYGFNSTIPTTVPPAAGCTPASGSATGTNTTTHTTATVTVNPANCLKAGTQVTVTGTGLVPSSTGSILECNGDPSQPTETVFGTAIPVSCTPIAIFTTTSSGGVPTGNQSFTVVVGTTGPPCSGPCTTPDSSGGAAATDAAKYPCPPTAAELAASPPDSCVIAIGDLGGDKVAVPIQFASGNLGSNPAPKQQAGGGTTATPKAKGGTTKTTTKALAFTGAGSALWVMGFVGLALILLGGSLLVLVDAPRRLLLVALRRDGRSQNKT